jgi:hypothetical protein
VKEKPLKYENARMLFGSVLAYDRVYDYEACVVLGCEAEAFVYEPG